MFTGSGYTSISGLWQLQYSNILVIEIARNKILESLAENAAF